MTDRNIMQQALGYMESVGKMDMYPEEWAIAVALRERLAQPEQEPVAIKWTLNAKTCRYNNWLGETPFGRILITWKGWKENPDACVDDFPGDFHASGSPDEVKELCEAEFAKRLGYTTKPQRKPDHIVDVTKMVPFQDLAAELFVVAQISPADDGFSDTITRIESWLRNHFSTLPQRKPLTDAVLAEREACAQLCETKHFSSPIREAGAKICAAAIRARGKT